MSKDKHSTLNEITIPSSHLKVNTRSLILSNMQSVFTLPCVSHKWPVCFSWFESGSKHSSHVAFGQCVFQVSPPSFFFFIFLPCNLFVEEPVLSCRVSHLLMHSLVSLLLSYLPHFTCLSLNLSCVGFPYVCMQLNLVISSC